MVDRKRVRTGPAALPPAACRLALNRAARPLKLVPGVQDLVVNRAYKLFPEGESANRQTAEQKAFIQATRGVHW